MAMPSKGNNIALQVIEDPFGDTRRVVSPNPEVDGKKVKRERKVDDYFVGPLDITHHSKWPYFFRIHGSILPALLVPLTLVAIWATIVTFMCKHVFKNHKFEPTLLTVLGFLVGLALSLRSSTAYERYNEGRKYWSQLTLTTHNLARIIWVHAREREGDQNKEDLLAKITAMNLLVAFAYSLKHRLRFEPYVDYDDMRGYVEFLDTFAKEANKGFDTATPNQSKQSKWKRAGEFLGVTFAKSNPRTQLKQTSRPLGNLPLEILIHLQSYFDGIIDNGTLKVPIYQVQSISSLATLNDVLTGTDRILNTPIPLAYSIAISQIAWTYIIIMPFQLYGKLLINTIPGTLLAAYIILGMLAIGTDIENPFGLGVNDLPLDSFCQQIATDLDIIKSSSAPKPETFVKNVQNLPLFPLSWAGYDSWVARSEGDIRKALKAKTNLHSDNYQTPGDSEVDIRGSEV